VLPIVTSTDSYKRITRSLVFAQNYCSSITSWFGQSCCRTAYVYISTRFWLHCSPSSAYFGPTDSSLDIYNPQAHKLPADVSLHCGPSAEVIQINGLNCDKLYTANVFEKSRTPKRFFPSNYRHVSAMHLTVFYIIFPAWHNITLNMLLSSWWPHVWQPARGVIYFASTGHCTRKLSHRIKPRMSRQELCTGLLTGTLYTVLIMLAYLHHAAESFLRS
jgi:hypothetical protein